MDSGKGYCSKCKTRYNKIKGKNFCPACYFNKCLTCHINLKKNRPSWKVQCLKCYYPGSQNGDFIESDEESDEE